MEEGTCPSPCIEIRGQSVGMGSLLHCVHSFQTSDSDHQALPVHAHCTILPAHYWTFYIHLNCSQGSPCLRQACVVVPLIKVGVSNPCVLASVLLTGHEGKPLL